MCLLGLIQYVIFFFRREHHDHLTLLTKQLLSQEGLPGGWADIIISTVDRVSLFVKPDIKNSSDDMDIRQYVHIKKVRTRKGYQGTRKEN